jgi:hypothetical protein
MHFFNLTGDTHPIHFHLVNVHVLSRQAFNPDVFLANSGNPDASLTGSARAATCRKTFAKLP